MTGSTINTKTGFSKFWFPFLAPILAVLFVQPPAFAHVPHDVIESLSLSPAFATDKTVFAVVRGSLLKSVDGGFIWKRLAQGLDNKSEAESVVIHPKSPNILYMSTLSDGIYKSENAGLSWHKVNSGLSQPRILKIFIPTTADTNTAYAVDKRGWINKTTDGGVTWAKIYSHPVPITEIAGDLLDDKHLFIGDANGAIFQSIDGGVVWVKLFEATGCGYIAAIGGNSNSLITGQTFFLGTEKCGIFRTGNGGKSFNKSNANIEDLKIRAITVSPDFANDRKVFVSTWTKAIFISADAGLTWKKYSQGITTTSQARLSGLADFKDVRISPDFKNDKTVYLGGFNGLFKSINGGAGWRELVTMPNTLIQSLAISPTYDVDSFIAINTYASGLYKSTDKGVSWKNALNNTSFRGYDVAFSPRYDQDRTLFASINPDIIAKSTDGGITWVNYPVHSAGPSIIALSPTFYDDQTLFAATRFGVVNKSTDGGKTYTAIYQEPKSPDCGDACLTALAVSPDYSVDNTLFLATKSTGIHISQDGGSTWSLKVPKQILYGKCKLAVSPDYAVDRTVFFGSTVGLFKTTDSFATWKRVYDNVLGATDYIEEVVVSPDFKNDNTVFVVVRGKGLFKSQNGGSTFAPIGLSAIKNNNLFTIWPGFPIPSLSSIKFSPKYTTDQTLFATSSERLFISRDKGESWGAILINTKLPN